LRNFVTKVSRHARRRDVSSHDTGFRRRALDRPPPRSKRVPSKRSEKMKKILTGLVAVALAAAAGVAAADEHIHLNETYASGATFSGDLTFTNGFQMLTGVDGTLSGGSYGTDAIGWTWWTGQGLSTPQNSDGNAATSEDWLMDGSAPSTYSHYIGLSWSAPGGNFQLTLTPDTNVYYAGINAFDAVVSATVSPVSSVPESSDAAMLAAGVGLLALVARRRQSRA
jgi:MYXO-CTERM domain-containing protein